MEFPGKSEESTHVTTYRLHQQAQGQGREARGVAGIVSTGGGFIEVNKPDTVAFLAYLSEDGSEVSTVHVFPDAEAMERHVEGVGERAQRAAEFLGFALFEVYGMPSDKVLKMKEQTEGVTLRIRPEHASGYLRLESG